MYNYGLIKFKKFGTDELGYLSAIEEMRDIPFHIKRVYFITDVPPETIRGFHAHRVLRQVLICMQGSVTIKIYNGNEKTEIVKNVHDFSGHIACDSASNSEIVVPIFKNDKLWGVFDFDSTEIANFGEEDQKYLEKIASLIFNH